jgi:uncharacterized protein YbjT (DUF2867 family)
MRFEPLVTIPALLARPVSAREVADVLADLLVEEPVTAVSSTPLEMAGPETLTLIEMVRKLQQRVGDRHLAVSVSLPGLAGRTMRHGGLIPRGPTFRQGTVTFTDWLELFGPFTIRTAGRLGDFLPESGHQTTASSACRMWLVTGFGTGLTR